MDPMLKKVDFFSDPASTQVETIQTGTTNFDAKSP
jgi:hypothetical protein